MIRSARAFSSTLLITCSLVAACSAMHEDPELPARLAGLVQRAQARRSPALDGDLRLEARRVLARLQAHTDPYLGQPSTFAGVTLPPTIRVWRKSLGSTASCSGQVDVLPFEEYVKGVLPHEWIPSWEVESLRAGAVAIRSYAAAWVAKGGKYTCADLDDTTSSQVYKDDRNAKASQAVDDTRGLVVVQNGNVVFAEYSAENGDPTAFNVSDPPCAGKTLYGHGRGMCQWGSQRWALQGKDHVWIAEHYYPGSQATSTLPIDAGPPPTPDQGPPPTSDQATPGDQVAAPPDVGAPPPADVGLADSGNPPPTDLHIIQTDRAGSTLRPGPLSGGCRLGGGNAVPTPLWPAPLWFAALLLLLTRLRKRPR